MDVCSRFFWVYTHLEVELLACIGTAGSDFGGAGGLFSGAVTPFPSLARDQFLYIFTTVGLSVYFITAIRVSLKSYHVVV